MRLMRHKKSRAGDFLVVTLGKSGPVTIYMIILVFESHCDTTFDFGLTFPFLSLLNDQVIMNAQFLANVKFPFTNLKTKLNKYYILNSVPI